MLLVEKDEGRAGLLRELTASAHVRGHSKTKIELLILFPLQMAALRLLNFKTEEIKPAHARRLDAKLGAASPYRDIVSMRMTGKIEPEQTEIAFLDAYAVGLHNSEDPGASEPPVSRRR